jgi:hypothetical protein
MGWALEEERKNASDATGWKESKKRFGSITSGMWLIFYKLLLRESKKSRVKKILK